MKGELQYRGGRNNNTLGIFARSWFPGTYIYIMGSVRKKIMRPKLKPTRSS
jgi:hypothetical protein